MKIPGPIWCLVSCWLVLAAPGRVVASGSGGGAGDEQTVVFTAEQIDEMLAPIALYPDPLIALILPAATFPADVVLAARFLERGGTAEAAEAQSWDDSVKALVRYPEVLAWMDENLAWTQQLGEVFAAQPAEVMNGTQRLRAAALAAGHLRDTPQQTVVVEREVVRIVPARREVIYVPVYDPVLVYRPWPAHVYYSGPLITFSHGYVAGFWLSHHFDWGHRTVVVVSRPHRTLVWMTYPSWHYPIRPTVVNHHYHTHHYQTHTWRPASSTVRPVRREAATVQATSLAARPTPNQRLLAERPERSRIVTRQNDPVARGGQFARPEGRPDRAVRVTNLPPVVQASRNLGSAPSRPAPVVASQTPPTIRSRMETRQETRPAARAEAPRVDPREQMRRDMAQGQGGARGVEPSANLDGRGARVVTPRAAPQAQPSMPPTRQPTYPSQTRENRFSPQAAPSRGGVLGVTTPAAPSMRGGRSDHSVARGGLGGSARPSRGVGLGVSASAPTAGQTAPEQEAMRARGR